MSDEIPEMPYPEEFQLVGGPYCGLTLKPYEDRYDTGLANEHYYGLLSKSVFYSPKLIELTGGAGVAMYEEKADNTWWVVPEADAYAIRKQYELEAELGRKAQDDASEA